MIMVAEALHTVPTASLRSHTCRCGGSELYIYIYKTEYSPVTDLAVKSVQALMRKDEVYSSFRVFPNQIFLRHIYKRSKTV